MVKKKDTPDQWGSHLLGEILSESLGRVQGELTITDFCRQILRIDPWVTQRAILKSFLNEPLELDELELLRTWSAAGKCNWVNDRQYKNLIIEAGMRSSKCIAGDSLIPTSRGVLRADELLPTALEDEIETDLLGIQVMTRKGVRHLAAGLSRPVESGWRIVTERGYSLGGSAVHPVLKAHSGYCDVYRRQTALPKEAPTDWASLEDLQPGDWVVQQLGNSLWGDDADLGYDGVPWGSLSKLPTVMSPELATFLAICQARLQRFSDGDNSGHLILYAKDDPAALQGLLAPLVQDLFGYELGNSRQDGMVGIYSRAFLAFLPHLGFSAKREEDAVPPLVRQGGRDTLQAYLRTYLTHNAALGRYGSYLTETEARIAHPSLSFLKELAQLLLLFGVRTRLVHAQLSSTRTGGYLLFQQEDRQDLERHVFGDSVRAPELSVDCIARKYPITKPLYDLSVPDTSEFIANGLVVHNTALCSILITYLIYRLYQMDDPGIHYGQLPGQPLFITTVATSEEQSKDTIFAYVCIRLEQSPYFQNLVRQDKLYIGKTRIEFPEKNLVVRAGHSNQAGLVGTTAPAFIMDEANRFASETGVSGLDMYENVGKATKSFARYDDMGFRMVISSAWEPGDVTDTIIDMARKDEIGRTKTLFFKLTTYEMNPTVTRDDFADVYELRPEKALRDFENIRPGSTERILNEAMVQLAMDSWHQQVGEQAAVFNDETTEESGQRYVSKALLHVRPVGGTFVSYAALDVAISGDSYALCIGHGIADPDGEGVIAVIDVLTAWKPYMDMKGRQHIVLFNNVEEVFLKLAKSRMVSEVHSDRYNSEGSLQLFNRNGILPIRSSETNKIQYQNYMMLKTALNQKKVWLPKDTQLLKEARHVMLVHGKKIDHPDYFDDKTPGAKDLLDVVSKVVARILKDDGRFYSYHEAAGGNLSTSMASRNTSKSGISDMKSFLHNPSPAEIRHNIGRQTNRFGW